MWFWKDILDTIYKMKGGSIIQKKIRTILSIMSILLLVVVPYSMEENISAQAINKVSLSQQLNQLLKNDPTLEGAIAGISIRSAATGDVLYENMANTRLRPASTMKLLTAAAALKTLGEEFRFMTDVKTDGSIKGNTLQGNLYLVGKGDPTLLKDDFDSLAKKVKKKGIKEIEGDLVADDSWYDSIRYSMDLPWSDEDTYYGAQISSLTAAPNKDYDAGTVIVEITPGKKPGKKASVILSPATSYVEIINNIKTVKTKEKTKELKITREHGTNTIILEGEILENSNPIREWVGVWEPTGYALELFKQSLAGQGIKINGTLIERRAPHDSHTIASHASMKLKDLLIPFMKLSNNGHAEVLIKEMGKRVKEDGSWEKGLEVLKTEMKELGINTGSLVIRDGSGVSHINLVPANEISTLLYVVQNQPWFPAYLEALPIAGIKDRMTGGTLRNRMSQEGMSEKVHAKTGTLTTVSSLAGYVDTSNGERVIFSIILNNLIDDHTGKKVEDQIVSIITSSQ